VHRNLELAIHLLAAAALWLLLPACGVLSAYPSTPALIAIIVIYGVWTNYAMRSGEACLILLGARINRWKVLAGFLGVNLVAPFALAELACFVMPAVELRSHIALLTAIAAGFVLQVALMAVMSRQRERLHTIELLKPIKLRQKGEHVYRTAVQRAELVETGLMIIEANKLDDLMGQLMRSHKAILGGDESRADELMVAALPDLSGGGFLGVLRLQQGFYILKQSAAAAGNEEMVSDCSQLIAMLEAAYRQGVVGVPM
jgi:hypothetical protein